MVREHVCACYCVLAEIKGCSFLLLVPRLSGKYFYRCVSAFQDYFITHFSMILHNSFKFNSVIPVIKSNMRSKSGPYMIRKKRVPLKFCLSCEKGTIFSQSFLPDLCEFERQILIMIFNTQLDQLIRVCKFFKKNL